MFTRCSWNPRIKDTKNDPKILVLPWRRAYASSRCTETDIKTICDNGNGKMSGESDNEDEIPKSGLATTCHFGGEIHE